MASLCQSQQRCVKASIVSSWRLAEAQDQLCSLGVHSSESLEQERARTQACPTELTHNEEEWRRKESLLGVQEPSRSPVFGASWDVFDKASLPNNIAKRTYRGAVFCAKILRPFCFRVSSMSSIRLQKWTRTSVRHFSRNTNKSSGILVSEPKRHQLASRFVALTLLQCLVGLFLWRKGKGCPHLVFMCKLK